MQIPSWLFWLIIILIPLVFLVNLDLQPFIDDEGNRSLVAMEMLWSGNYVTPTLHGAYYYNKPPLWNWILNVSFQLFGEANEWSARFPSILALIGYTATIFAFYRKHVGFNRAFLIALIFITSGRILFWESLLALIDITFSWTIFTLFIVIFKEGEQKRWWRLFMFSYLFMVVGFMFKGLPAIVFQGLTIITYLFWKNEWKRLFSIAHITSGLLAVALLGIYYATYHQYNNLETIFQTLFVESSKRTAVSYELLDTFKHILNFPLEVFYHFLPWTILAVLLIWKEYRQRLSEHRIITYGLWVCGVNIIIYWLSPNFYPRYILMLLPLGIAALVQALPEIKANTSWPLKAIQVIFGVAILVLIGADIAVLFIKETQGLELLMLKIGLVAIALAIMLYLYYKQPTWRWFIFAACLLIFRLGFDWFALPPRSISEFSTGQRLKDSAIDFAKRWDGKSLAVFNETDMESTVSFYMENTLQYIVPRHLEELEVGQHYIYNPDQYAADIFGVVVDSFAVRHTESPYYYVAPLLDNNIEAVEAATIRQPRGF